MYPNRKQPFSLSFLVLVTFLNVSTLHAQDDDLCGVQVSNVNTSVVLGNLVGYTVKLQNTKQQTIDHLIWKVAFTDNSGTVIETTQGVFNSTNLIAPIQPRNSKRFIRTVPKIKGASRAKVTLTRVHTIAGETCTSD